MDNTKQMQTQLTELWDNFANGDTSELNQVKAKLLMEQAKMALVLKHGYTPPDAD